MVLADALRIRVGVVLCSFTVASNSRFSLSLANELRDFFVSPLYSIDSYYLISLSADHTLLTFLAYLVKIPFQKLLALLMNHIVSESMD